MSTKTLKKAPAKAKAPQEEVKETSKVQSFAVNADVLQAVVNYLGQQPFSQVANLIGALQQSKPIE